MMRVCASLCRQGLVAVGLLVLGSGCASTARITWDTPTAQPRQDMTVYVKPTQYSGANTTVGKHTFTVFALPVGSISAHRPVDECVTKAVADGIRSAGYDVKTSVEPPPNAAVVQPVLSKFNYWSYSWFWPLFFEGGKVSLDLEGGTSGAVTWNKTYDASSFWLTPVGAFGFDSAIKGDMTKIVVEIQKDTGSTEFREAITVKKEQ